MTDKLSPRDGAEASLTRSGGVMEGGQVVGHYVAECYDKDGNLKWREEYDNVVTDLGAQLWLNTAFNNTAMGTPILMGLKGTGSAVAADTQASHAGWLEVGLANAPTYSGNRPSPSFSAASGTGAGNRQKATSSAVAFTFTGSGTVAGSFINIGGSTTKDNTTGTLFSAGDFSGSKTVVSTDVLNVTYTLNI
jgi:hypothetical protein